MKEEYFPNGIAESEGSGTGVSSPHPPLSSPAKHRD